MRTVARRDWWTDDPDVAMCPIKTCGCPIQRTPKGSLENGMRKHFEFVHPGRERSSERPAPAPRPVDGAS